MTKTPLCITVLTFAALIGMANSVQAGDAPALLPNDDGVLFSIGIEDKKRDEFKVSDWTGVSEHACTVGIDCDAGDFPARLTAAYAASGHDEITVERGVISFNLGEASDNLVLVMARYGYEPSVVIFDQGAPLIVTRDMMDPPRKEEYLWGRFELSLGPAAPGMHVIELSVLDEKIENGRHSVDAIVLKSVPPSQ